MNNHHKKAPGEPGARHNRQPSLTPLLKE